MKNLEQIRASNAIHYIDTEFPGADGGEVVKKVPTMIRENGLLAAAAFAVEKKGNDGEYKNPGHCKVFKCVIEHLSHPLVKKVENIPPEKFVKFVASRDSVWLRDITAESMAYLNYLRRFAKKKNNQRDEG